MVILDCALAGRNGQSFPRNIQLFFLPQLTASSKIVEHAVMLYRVRLKRIIIKILKPLALLRKDLVHLRFPFFFCCKTSHMFMMLFE